MAEQPLPLTSAMPEVLLLGRLIAARNAARVSLRGVHSGPPLLERATLAPVRGALARPALSPFAVRRHRSSVLVEVPIRGAYHVTTE